MLSILIQSAAAVLRKVITDMWRELAPFWLLFRLETLNRNLCALYAYDITLQFIYPFEALGCYSALNNHPWHLMFTNYSQFSEMINLWYRLWNDYPFDVKSFFIFDIKYAVFNIDSDIIKLLWYSLHMFLLIHFFQTTM